MLVVFPPVLRGDSFDMREQVAMSGFVAARLHNHGGRQPCLLFSEAVASSRFPSLAPHPQSLDLPVVDPPRRRQLLCPRAPPQAAQAQPPPPLVQPPQTPVADEPRPGRTLLLVAREVRTTPARLHWRHAPEAALLALATRRPRRTLVESRHKHTA